MISRVVPWVPAAIWAAVLFFVSSRPQIGVPLDGGLDKVAHFFAYLVLGFLLVGAADRTEVSPALAAAIGIVYGMLEELRQHRMPTRTGDVLDWVADTAGVAVGLLIYFGLKRMGSQRSREASAERISS